MRNLDITTLRSFVTIVEVGGVSRAANALALTQSAVSMQIKRLEELLGQSLFDRAHRRVTLTVAGEKLYGPARQMVDLNDRIFTTLSHGSDEGELTLGVPHDIIFPLLPDVLRRFRALFPRIKVQLISEKTLDLKVQFAAGACDLIVTTEEGCDAGGETLRSAPLVWAMRPGGTSAEARPLRLANGQRCLFRAPAIAALEAAEIEWEAAIDTDSDRSVEATVHADLGVTLCLDGHVPAGLVAVRDPALLPPLPRYNINLYVAQARESEVIRQMAEMLRGAYATLRVVA